MDVSRKTASQRTRCIACALLTVLACSLAPAAGKPLQLVDPRNGDTVRVGLDARATHLVFFATWCPPCVEELDTLAGFAERWEERGYRLIVVAVSTRQSADGLSSFASRAEVPGRLLFDTDGAVQKRFRATDLPTHIVVDASGAEVVRGDSLGPVEDVLESMLTGERPARKR